MDSTTCQHLTAQQFDGTWVYGYPCGRTAVASGACRRHLDIAAGLARRDH